MDFTFSIFISDLRTRKFTLTNLHLGTHYEASISAHLTANATTVFKENADAESVRPYAMRSPPISFKTATVEEAAGGIAAKSTHQQSSKSLEWFQRTEYFALVALLVCILMVLCVLILCIKIRRRNDKKGSRKLRMNKNSGTKPNEFEAKIITYINQIELCFYFTVF